jgi:hypothetical protein
VSAVCATAAANGSALMASRRLNLVRMIGLEFLFVVAGIPKKTRV